MMKKPILLFVACALLIFSTKAGAFEIKKTAIYVFLHEVKPIEEEAAEALENKKYAPALRKYREALRGYERIWKDFPDLPNERPRGTDLLVDEAIENCKKIIDEIKEKGEAEDEFFQKLREPVRVDFKDEDIRKVAKSLTFLTDVNVIVDDTIFRGENDVVKMQVNVRTDEPWPLRTIITRICQQTGLAYSIETDHVFISTRVKVDEQR